MKGAFTVRPLECEHCGSQLPVMGQFVTFQCPNCFLYWTLSPRGLEPLTAYRAEPTREPGAETIYLPFWTIEIDSRKLRAQATSTVAGLQEKNMAIAGAPAELDKKAGIDDLLSGNFECATAAGAAELAAKASGTISLPPPAEVDHLLRRIESAGRYYIYVPAFKSVNTYAYLKVGRLMTKRQPAYRVVKSSGAPRSILCALQADEALSLMDFVFFATLPDSIRQCGRFLERIRLEPTGNPYLIEFPFERAGSSLSSLVAEFHISGRLVELSEPVQRSL